MNKLPLFVSPMLAALGRPFDSEDFFFEYKWDGYRAGAYVEDGRLRLMSRKGLDVTAKYPGLSRLGSLPDGLALDGELVAFVDGRPSFEGMQRSGGARSAVSFVAFDVLYSGYESAMDKPFSERRRLLEDAIGGFLGTDLMLSEGLRAGGAALFEKSRELGLEGVMAKRISSAYAAGKRNGAWIKIKHRVEAQLAIIGFIEKETDFQCLLVAGTGLAGGGTASRGGASRRPEAGDDVEPDSTLRYVGRVGGGFTDELRGRLNALLREHPRKTPLVACPEKGRWIEPGLYCTVSFTEITSQGLLRAPVFEALIEA